MRTSRLYLTFLAALLLAGIAPAGSPDVPPLAPVPDEPGYADASGKAAPDFTLPLPDGETFTLSSLQGESGAMVVFFATWCVKCMAEVPHLIEFHAAYAEAGVPVYAVNHRQDAAVIESFIKDRGPNYFVLRDEDGAVSKAYGANPLPVIVGIDRNGIERYRGTDLPEDKAAFVKLLTGAEPPQVVARPPDSVNPQVPVTDPTGNSTEDRAKQLAKSGSLLVYFPLFLLGVLFSLTPCVYPVLPIVVSVVTARADGKTYRAFLLAMSYAVGMALVYSALGVLVGASGKTFGELSANPYVLFVVANIFVFMALWLMDAVTIPMPGFLTRHRGPSKGGFGATFLAGAASALVVGPCTAPGIVLVLGVVQNASKGRTNVAGLIYGGTMMFAFALGMTTLLVAAATFSGMLTALPKPGNWMNVVKKCLGIFLILMAEYYIFSMAKKVSFSQYPFLKSILSAIGLL